MTVDVWAARLERPLEEQKIEALLAIMPMGRRKRLEGVQAIIPLFLYSFIILFKKVGCKL